MYKVVLEYIECIRGLGVCRGRNDSCMVTAILCVYSLEEMMRLIV